MGIGPSVSGWHRSTIRRIGCWRSFCWVSSMRLRPCRFVLLCENARTSAPLAEVVVFDFGAGGAAWISAQGSDWLIDTGAHAHDSVLLPFLRSRGLRSLDGFLVTGDAGHIGSAAELVSFCPPRQVADSALDDRSASRSRLHAELARLAFPSLFIAREIRFSLALRCVCKSSIPQGSSARRLG
jgi:beta-lactamase superfamily II metal-dependent hydrolase